MNKNYKLIAEAGYKIEIEKGYIFILDSDIVTPCLILQTWKVFVESDFKNDEDREKWLLNNYRRFEFDSHSFRLKKDQTLKDKLRIAKSGSKFNAILLKIIEETPALKAFKESQELSAALPPITTNTAPKRTNKRL